MWERFTCVGKRLRKEEAVTSRCFSTSASHRILFLEAFHEIPANLLSLRFSAMQRPWNPHKFESWPSLNYITCVETYWCFCVKTHLWACTCVCGPMWTCFSRVKPSRQQPVVTRGEEKHLLLSACVGTSSLLQTYPRHTFFICSCKFCWPITCRNVQDRVRAEDVC